MNVNNRTVNNRTVNNRTVNCSTVDRGANSIITASVSLYNRNEGFL